MPLLPFNIPAALAEKIAGYTWERNTLGMSAEWVLHLPHPTQPAYYLKASPDMSGV
ncbi:MAG: hypothetical protein KJ063_13435 [Anaerolineae bacterium]|nr:hypothetical protein [Anaerolineae bacterium]